MSEEIKVAAEAPKPTTKPSPRELLLEGTLKDAIVTVENLLVIVQRMGMRSLSSEEWIKQTKELLNGSK